MPNSITITSPNPAVIARLQEELPKLLALLERVTEDKHTKRGYALTTISNEPVLTDAACKHIAAVCEYLGDEESSYIAHVEDGGNPEDHIWHHRQQLLHLIEA